MKYVYKEEIAAGLSRSLILSLFDHGITLDEWVKENVSFDGLTEQDTVELKGFIRRAFINRLTDNLFPAEYPYAILKQMEVDFLELMLMHNHLSIHEDAITRSLKLGQWTPVAVEEEPVTTLEYEVSGKTAWVAAGTLIGGALAAIALYRFTRLGK